VERRIQKIEQKAAYTVILPNGYGESKLNNVLFTVKPSSIALLDPNKPGGDLPMILQHYFYTELNSGDSVNISFRVYLWENYITG